MLEITKLVTGTDDLTLEEAKTFMRVDFDEEDELITNLISQARNLIEVYTNRSLIESGVIAVLSARKEYIPSYGPVYLIVDLKDKDGNAVDYEWDGLKLTFKTKDTLTLRYDTKPDNTFGLMLGWKETVSYLYENRADTSNIGLILYYNQNLMPFRRSIWI